MKAEVFLDTVYVIALTAATDQHHDRAVELANAMRKLATRMLTTQAVLLEVGNSLAKLRYRAESVQLLRSLRTDSSVEIAPIDANLFARGFDLYQSRPDKEWGLVDCISFVLMADRGLTEALTSDEHFEQAGFVALLRSGEN